MEQETVKIEEEKKSNELGDENFPLDAEMEVNNM